MNHLVPFIKKVIVLPDWLPAWDVSEHPEWRGTAKGLWIEPGKLLTLINGWQVVQWAIGLSYRLQPSLRPVNGPGRKPTYSDATVLLSVIVMRVWRKGYESFSGWLGRNATLATNLGYMVTNEQGQLQTISSSHLSRRARQLGFWSFLFFLIALVWQLIRLGAITGRDLIMDASILKAWYHHDREAGWSYPTPWLSSIFGYKIHANPFVDYNVRRNNKQVVTLEFMVAWEGLMAPRNNIERHFA